MIADHKDLTRVTYLVAAYRQYLKYHKDDNGENFEIAEPWLTDNDRKLIASDDATAFLHLSPFQATDLAASNEFTSQYLKFVSAIAANGAMKTLETIIN
jgi:mannitol 2-dehydrogenase